MKEHNKRNNSKKKERNKEENSCKKAAKLMEEMYAKIGRYQKDEYWKQLQEYFNSIEGMVQKTIFYYDSKTLGKRTKEQKKKLYTLQNSFQILQKESNSKFKIYIRGCGKAGKSTLLNALLEVDDTIGSKIDLKPMTFTIDTFTNEMQLNEAIIRKVVSNGLISETKMSRNEALKISNEERSLYEASKKKCEQLIESRTKQTTLQSEISDIKKQIYTQHLLKPTIREIKWGIGKNDFLQNCLVIDTPGLNQELHVANTFEDVKNYEADGIIWVISSEGLQRQATLDDYQKEMEEFAEIYANKKLIGVVNVIDDDAIEPKLTKRYIKAARKIFGEEVTDIVCVNNKMAYEGFLENNAEKLRKSNIAELKTKINLRFVEKSSDEFIERQARKIASFLASYKEILEYNILEIQKAVDKYEKISLLIQGQRNDCLSKFERKKDQISNKYIAIYKNRIDQNANYVSNMYKIRQENPKEWEWFLKEKIIVNNEISKEFSSVQKTAEKETYQSFKALEMQCVVSDYQTKKFAYENFKETIKSRNELQVMKEPNVSFITDGRYDWENSSVVNAIESIFGWNSTAGNFARGVARWLERTFSNPHNVLKKQIEEYVDNVSSNFDLDTVLDEYEKYCKQIQENSMTDYMGLSTDMKDLFEELKTQKEEKCEWELKEITFQDIIKGDNAYQLPMI